MVRLWKALRGLGRQKPICPEVSARELAAALAAACAPVLVDIRPVEQFVAGHLPGAMNLPFARLSEVAAALDRGAPTVVY